MNYFDHFNDSAGPVSGLSGVLHTPDRTGQPPGTKSDKPDKFRTENRTNSGQTGTDRAAPSPPVALGYVTPDGQYFVIPDCPYCHREHTHGAPTSPGERRLAHCSPKWSGREVVARVIHSTRCARLGSVQIGRPWYHAFATIEGKVLVSPWGRLTVEIKALLGNATPHGLEGYRTDPILAQGDRLVVADGEGTRHTVRDYPPPGCEYELQAVEP